MKDDSFMLKDLTPHQYKMIPRVVIRRGDKMIIQQSSSKDNLLRHLAEKYPDWNIIESNF